MVLVLSNFFFKAPSLFPHEFIDALCSGIIWRNKIVSACVAAGVYIRLVQREKDRFVELRLKALRARPFFCRSPLALWFVFFLRWLAYLSFTQTAAKPRCADAWFKRPEHRHSLAKNACANKQRLLMPPHWQPGTTFFSQGSLQISLCCQNIDTVHKICVTKIDCAQRIFAFICRKSLWSLNYMHKINFSV